METILVMLSGVAILLFVISFFLPDHFKDLKEEVDQLSLKYYQDTYKLKKRMAVLEEELLLPNEFENGPAATNAIIKKQVVLLAEQGMSVEKISQLSALSIEEVRNILQLNEEAK